MPHKAPQSSNDIDGRKALRNYYERQNSCCAEIIVKSPLLGRYTNITLNHYDRVAKYTLCDVMPISTLGALLQHFDYNFMVLPFARVYVL